MFSIERGGGGGERGRGASSVIRCFITGAGRLRYDPTSLHPLDEGASAGGSLIAAVAVVAVS